VFKFHDDSTVNESGIVILLKQVWDMREKESYDVKDISLTLDIVSQIPTVKMFENEFLTWFSNFMSIQRLMYLESSFY